MHSLPSHRGSAARRSSGLYWFCCLVAIGSLHAQEKPASSTAPAPAAKPVILPATSVQHRPEDEVLALNPFAVVSERDYGYLATNASTATGSGAAVRDTPVSIAILTEEYIRDKNMVDIQEAIRNISSITAEGKEENVVTSRGFQAVLKQDGNEVEGVYDTSNVARVEVVKGAVSILQGRASAGGVINVITRRPKFRPQTEIRAGYGSYDYTMGSIMNTGPLFGGKVAYLFGYTKSNRNDGWVDYTYRNEESIQGAISFKPTDKLLFTVDYQGLARKENNAQHLSFSNPAFIASELEAEALYDAKGLARPAAYPRIGETTRAWLNRTPGYGPNVPSETVDVMEAMYPDGYRANIQGPEQFRNNRTSSLAVEAQWTITPWLYLKSSAAHRDRQTDSINWSTFRAAGGLTMTARASRSLVVGKSDYTRHELVGLFDVLNTKHRMLAGFEFQQGTFVTRTLQAPAMTYNPRTQPVRYLLTEITAANPNGFPPLVYSNGDGDPIRSYYMVDQVKIGEDRVNLLVGGRYSEQQRGDIASSKFPPQAGVVVRIPHLEEVSVYASYGESYRPNFNRDGLGNRIPPIEEVNYEAGIKTELFDGKISGTATVYRLDQKNVSLRDFAREAELGITGLYILSGLARSSGFESDVVISPQKNYQIMLSFSRIWQAETLKAEDIRQQGVRLQGAPEAQFSFWNKYTFTAGRLKGAYLGAGLRWTGVMRVHPSFDSPIDAKPNWYGDLTAGYTFKVKKADVAVALNIKNLFDEFYYNQTFRSSDPRQFFLTSSLKF